MSKVTCNPAPCAMVPGWKLTSTVTLNQGDRGICCPNQDLLEHGKEPH